MKYIKINTPLAVKGGFTINSALVRMHHYYSTTKQECVVVADVYKDYDAYNKREDRLKLKADLPDYVIGDGLKPSFDVLTEHKMLDVYLSILKANDYDVEIVDTDDVCNISASIIDVQGFCESIKKNRELADGYTIAKDTVDAVMNFYTVYSGRDEFEMLVDEVKAKIKEFDKTCGLGKGGDLNINISADIESLPIEQRIEVYELLSKYVTPSVSISPVEKEVKNPYTGEFTDVNRLILKDDLNKLGECIREFESKFINVNVEYSEAKRIKNLFDYTNQTLSNVAVLLGFKLK